MAPKELILLTVQIGLLPLIVVITLYSMILYKAIQTIIQFQNKEVNLSHITNGKVKICDSQRPDKQNISFRCQRCPSGSGVIKSSSKWKAVKVVLFTTGAFSVTWLPYYITIICYIFQCNEINKDDRCKKLRDLIASPLAILGFSNSLLNPLIYAWWHKGFRSFLQVKWIRMKNGMHFKKESKIQKSETVEFHVSVLSNLHSNRSTVF